MNFWPNTKIVKSMNNDFNVHARSSVIGEEMQDIHRRKVKATSFVNDKRMDNVDPLNIGALSGSNPQDKRNVSRFVVKLK